MNLSKWSMLPNRLVFGSKLNDNSGLLINNADLSHKNFWNTSLSSTGDGYGSSTSDVTDNYATSFSGSEMTSKRTSEPSTWSLVSAASTSTSSFYPACTPLTAPKPYEESGPIKARAQQQQEISINLGRENDDDSETEKGQTIDTSSIAKRSTGSLTQDVLVLAEKVHSLSQESNCILINGETDEKEEKLQKLIKRIAELETEKEEQKKTISKLKEEIAKQRVVIADGKQERENLLIRNASLCHQLEYEKREWSIEREQLAMQLDDVTRELELQKMLLNSESISEIVQRWENKVFDLQGMIYDRDRAIRAQQQRISELVKHPQMTADVTLSTSVSIKRAVLQLLTGRHHRSSEQSLKTLSNVLQLTNDEEAAIRKNIGLH